MKINKFGSLGAHGAPSVYIGVDQSLTGYAVCALDPQSGEHSIWVFKPSTRGSERLVELRTAVNEYLDLWEVEDVAMEGALVYKHDHGSALGEVVGVTKELLFTRFHKAPMSVPPSVLKKYATGRGTSQKSIVMMSVFKKWGVELPDDNAADAYVLARICAGLADTPHEADAVLKCADPKYRV